MKDVTGEEREEVLKSLPLWSGCGPEGEQFCSGQDRLEHDREQDVAKRKQRMWKGEQTLKKPAHLLDSNLQSLRNHGDGQEGAGVGGFSW